ncbi:MAG: helix-turn-helix domain-containing protein [Candidatus Cybelea sp.]
MRKTMQEGGGASGSSDFGTLLRRYRLEAGLSQEQLAERARLSFHGISALERGFRRTPQPDTVALLAVALALDDEQRVALETAAARSTLPRRRSENVTLGPWLKAGPSKLPLSLTSFIGRARELEEIAALARGNRLVTITGAGGIGKTQTALRAATTIAEGRNGGVHFVGLATVSEEAVVAAIAAALGVREAPNEQLLDSVLMHLRDRDMLMILDNCEHVLPPAASIVETLLQSCPDLRILAISREPLKAGGERAYCLRSLSVDDGCKLFADRARAVDHRFALTDDNAAIAARICRRLDGNALAIELAAARVNVLSLKALAENLENHLSILDAGERTALARQQTMRATIEWSYGLLSPREQRIFERLSVLDGGGTLEIATTVCASDDIAEDDVLDTMLSLIDKSIVAAELDGAEPRYRLLEPFREFARERLAMRDEEWTGFVER